MSSSGYERDVMPYYGGLVSFFRLPAIEFDVQISVRRFLGNIFQSAERVATAATLHATSGLSQDRRGNAKSDMAVRALGVHRITSLFPAGQKYPPIARDRCVEL